MVGDRLVGGAVVGEVVVDEIVGAWRQSRGSQQSGLVD